MDQEFEPVSEPVWAIIPTYCEAENIAVVIKALSEGRLDLNILIVDDNSPDGTAEIADEVRKNIPGIEILKRDAKTSLGEAYLAGFKYALSRGAMVIVTMDCDLSHDPLAVPALIDALEDNGCVVGSRYVSGGTIVNWPFHRRALSLSANWFVRMLFRMPVKDCTSGFRVYRSEIVEKILKAKIHSHGYSFQVEALRIAVGSDLGVREFPIAFVERVKGVSKMGWNEIVEGVHSLSALRLNLFRNTKSK